MYAVGLIWCAYRAVSGEVVSDDVWFIDDSFIDD
jgi:hypothetical protein